MTEQLTLDLLWEEQSNKERESKLSPRQWALYRLIKNNSLLGLETSQKEICEQIEGYTYNDNEKAHDHCPVIWADINAINLSSEIEKIIIYKNFSAHIAHSQEELDEFIDMKWDELAPRLFRYWFLKKKANRDGQGKLLSTKLNPIDEKSAAREFVESYLRED